MIHRLACCLLLFRFFSSPAQVPGFIGVRGDEMVGADGKPFLIRGTNLGNWLVPEGYMFKFHQCNSPRLINEALTELLGPEATAQFWKKYLNDYIQKEDIRYLGQLGMNCIRVPFNYRLFTSEEYLGGQGPARGFALLDRLVSWCREAHIYIILDMHCAPGGQTGDNIDDGFGFPFLFDSPECQKQTISVWRRIAEHYRNEPVIMGYDLLNEPIAHYFDTAHFNHRLEPLYQSIVRAIREVDARHLVFLGGAQWDSNFKIFGPPFDSKAVYEFHKYWTAPTVEVIQQYLDFRERYRVPIYVGETGENDNAWIRTFREMLESHRVGWQFWPYKKMNDPRGIVTFSMPAHYEQIIAYADSPRASFASIRRLRPKDDAWVQQALEGFLAQCQFSQCRPNTEYIEALGLGKTGP